MSQRLQLVLPGLLLLGIGVALGSRAQADEPKVEFRENIVYGKTGGEELTLHLAKPVDAKGLPGILFIHRGGWVGGSKDRYRKVIADFAAHGYVVASVGYRFAPKHRFPSQVEDCKCAVRWMRAHAEELGVDPRRIGAIGESAGGYLSMMLGTLDPADGMEGDGGWPDQSSKVQAVVSFYGPTDLRWESFATGAPQGFLDGVARRLLTAYVGAAPEKSSELLYKASPIKYVDAADAPMMLIQGTDDPLVLPSQATLMLDALAKAGVEGRAEFILGKRHDWDGDDFSEPLNRARQFFAERLKTPDPPSAGAQKKWDPQLAAKYLDARAAEWVAWPKSARSHDSNCISCHTTMPYLLVRGALGRKLRESELPTPATKLLADIRRRVDVWSEAKPWYASSEEKIAESRGTEAVINALLLSVADATSPLPVLRPSTKTAIANLWATQRSEGENKGSWAWLDFELEPWESAHAEYWGAALAAVAVGLAPQTDAAKNEVSDKFEALRSYLRTGLQGSSVSLHNRAMLLLASYRLPGLLDSAEQATIADALLRAQRADGSWSLSELGDWKLKHAESDAYATGLCAFVLNQSPEAHYAGAARNGAYWLARNQDPNTGAWPARSLNETRDPTTMAGQFTQDAATAFAVLALTDIEW